MKTLFKYLFSEETQLSQKNEVVIIAGLLPQQDDDAYRFVNAKLNVKPNTPTGIPNGESSVVKLSRGTLNSHGLPS